MAKVREHTNGTKTFQPTLKDGKRPTFYLGKVTKDYAEKLRMMIDDLILCSISGQDIKRGTAIWLKSDCSDKLYSKLADHGLVEPRRIALLGDFTQQFIDRYPYKESTKDTLRRARNHLIGYFGPNRDMSTITESEAAEFWLWMLNERNPKLHENTARKTISIARQFWKQAKRQGCVGEHPFGQLSATVKGNPKKMHFVTMAEIEQVLAACPTQEWQTLVALARFGALRIPSEIKPLLWEHVDWTNGWITIYASKTEHHENGGIRRVPIFNLLYPYLWAAYEGRMPEERYVLPTLWSHTNPGVQLKRIIKNTGLKPWRRVWQNMRSTRQTELIELREGGLVKACAWCGNTPAVALKHYAQLRDEDFQKVAPKAVHNAVQQIASKGGKVMQGMKEAITDAANNTIKNNPLQTIAVQSNHMQGVESGPYRT